jgi:hypothetical protein
MEGLRYSFVFGRKRRKTKERNEETSPSLLPQAQKP